MDPLLPGQRRPTAEEYLRHVLRSMMQRFFAERGEEALRCALVVVRQEYAIAMDRLELYCGFGPPTPPGPAVQFSVTAALDSMELDRAGVRGRLDDTLLLRLAQTEFETALEDAHVEREVRGHRERLIEATRLQASATQINELAHVYRDAETHARRHHRREPPPDARVRLDMLYGTRLVRPEFAAVVGIDWGEGGSAPDHDAVEAKGKELLLAHLTAEQRERYESHGYFDVQGSAGGRYRIAYGRSINIAVLSADGLPTGRKICFLPRGGLCTSDVMLAQKITLENDEPAALAVANKFGPGTTSRGPVEPHDYYDIATDSFRRSRRQRSEAEIVAEVTERLARFRDND